jgi:hypothetical protein
MENLVMPNQPLRCLVYLSAVLCCRIVLAADDRPAPDFSADVAPLLTKYCAGCHGGAEPDGKLSLESFADLQRGGKHGPAVLAGDAASSRMIRLVTGAAEPKMPPAEEPVPTADEIAVLERWVAAGARGPEGLEPDRLRLITPAIASQTSTRPVADVALSPDGRWLAVARYADVQLENVSADRGKSPARKIGEYPGKVNAVDFSKDGTLLVTASGVEGLGGVAAVWNVADGALVREFRGHRDTLYDAELSPDALLLATCGYDREIVLWDVATGAQVRTFSGHNGAVYDVAFSPDGAYLASASADDTCKVWRVADGERLDTLGQPLKEQYCIAFSPDGETIVAGGADNRIRVWKFISRDKPRINPLLHARFAHEGAVLDLAFTIDGTRLASLAADRTIKVWETAAYTELALQTDPFDCSSLAVSPGGERLVAGRFDGSLVEYPVPPPGPPRSTGEAAFTAVTGHAAPAGEMSTVSEVEPNTLPTEAQTVAIPATMTGSIAGGVDGRIDEDCFRFTARAGEEWVLEVNAARAQSPLDSYLEVLTSDGRPIERVLLQAVRDSYFTFRGKNADEANDFRVFNWEEMELNQYLYANGEVTKLWLYPRGPDSGFIVYPGSGKRWGYFDTTPLAHALGEPCYIVEPHPPGGDIIPNGLPVFPVYFENDDESSRALGADSKLYFTPPADGEYVVRLRDVRGFQSENHKYTLNIRPRQPDFSVTVHNQNPTVSPGTAREFKVTVDRLDGFDGAVTVELTGLPPGFTASTPIVIQEGQIEAYGVLMCAEDAPGPTEEQKSASTARSAALIRGAEVTHDSAGLGTITRGDAATMTIAIGAAPGGAVPVGTTPEGVLEFVLHPGETIMLQATADRRETMGEISFGNEGSGRNLPHGSYIDNIGLNGLLMLSDQSQREFFVTAAPWLPDQSRLFHLTTGAGGGHSSRPVLLHIRRRDGAGGATQAAAKR